MRRVAAALMAVLVVAGGVVLAAASGDKPSGTKYRAVFDNAFGLTKGGDLKIAGVRAGQTTGFKVSRQKPRKAVVEFEISEPGVGELREDARCEIRPQSLIGEYFVDCQPGSSDKPLKEGGTIDVANTSSTIPVDLVNNVLRRPYRERLRLIIAELGTGLAGRGEDLSEVLRRAHPGLRETSKTLRILGDQRRTIKKFITDAQVVTEQLENRKADVARWVVEAGDTATITASRRADLQRNFALLPDTLDELKPYMARLGELADEQVPLLADLETAGPDLDTFLARLGPFSDASRPAFRGLGKASVAGSKAFAATDEEVAKLRELARNAPGLAKPLRQLLVTLDDRKRAVENDPRAKATAPPAPDKTAISGSGGFTGFEGLWDYFFWQALAINGRDDVGHVLKIIGIEDPDCTPYYATDQGEEETFKRCNQFLGPDQPGITTPDPVAGGSASASSATKIRAAAAPGSERQADSPGETVRKLFHQLPGADDQAAPKLPLPSAPQAPSATSPTPTQDRKAPLLDYLLAP